ncbi:dephospho-CoA kinase [Kordia sp. YSTF-M3]|uniref:Dephospho-CoA kinase n=1 Tax=Kordia aestuariivivens TaxID=2759037 RepID=A0ABR7QC67_9FLAO|nr:dephospho-CoA kinase [Kordia aestuariivivens]MBC8756179.1 dephospho-CoA kinase [Kordia aestuariivivens]
MIVGLTGGIGSGKTTIAKMFHELGVSIYIADIEAKKLMHTSEAIKKELIAAFGKETYVNGELNRSYLSNIVFNQPKELQKINAIVHPRVGQHFKDWYEARSDEKYVIKEAAILFENDSYKQCDKIITVVAPIEERFRRILLRDTTTREAVQDRMNNQWSDEKKMALSDYIIHNVDLAQARAQVFKIHQEISLLC